jgi:hypothetical protein
VIQKLYQCQNELGFKESALKPFALFQQAKLMSSRTRFLK